LGPSKDVTARYYSIDETHRPVRLRRVVLGYPDASTEFKFDLALNYRLGSVIQIYSDQKPSLVVSISVKSTCSGSDSSSKGIFILFFKIYIYEFLAPLRLGFANKNKPWVEEM